MKVKISPKYSSGIKLYSKRSTTLFVNSEDIFSPFDKNHNLLNLQKIRCEGLVHRNSRSPTSGHAKADAEVNLLTYGGFRGIHRASNYLHRGFDAVTDVSCVRYTERTIDVTIDRMKASTCSKLVVPSIILTEFIRLKTKMKLQVTRNILIPGTIGRPILHVPEQIHNSPFSAVMLPSAIRLIVS